MRVLRPVLSVRVSAVVEPAPLLLSSVLCGGYQWAAAAAAWSAVAALAPVTVCSAEGDGDPSTAPAPDTSALRVVAPFLLFRAVGGRDLPGLP